MPVYFLSGLQLRPELFFQQLALLYLLVLCSRSLAFMAAALLPAFPMSVLLAQAMFTMFLLSSGYIFNLDNLFVGTL